MFCKIFEENLEDAILLSFKLWTLSLRANGVSGQFYGVSGQFYDVSDSFMVCRDSFMVCRDSFLHLFCLMWAEKGWEPLVGQEKGI